jgi:Fe-S oxidoreductase
MERSGRESFCCGAGGGQLWLHEARGTRINAARTKQALSKNPSIVATSCPYCLVMFEDGLKDEKADEGVHVYDVSELLAKGLVAAKS